MDRASSHGLTFFECVCMVNSIQLELAARFATENKSLEDIWLSGRPTFARLLGRVWAEVRPMASKWTFVVNGRDEVIFPLSEGSFLVRTIAWENLVNEWRKHLVMKRLVRRHLEEIEARLWAVPEGPMIRRIWREVNHSSGRL